MRTLSYWDDKTRRKRGLDFAQPDNRLYHPKGYLQGRMQYFSGLPQNSLTEVSQTIWVGIAKAPTVLLIYKYTFVNSSNPSLFSRLLYICKPIN